MELADYQSRIVTEAAELRAIAASLDADTPVSTCQGWTMQWLLQPWHFTPTAPKTAAFWSRRMAHEVTVHRIDAHAAAGTDSAVDADFAADGVAEVLTRLIQRRTDAWAVGTRSGTVLCHAADAGRSWTVRLVAGQLPQTVSEAVTEPDASVIGLADAVYRAAWGRPSGAVISGDITLVEATRAG